MAYVELFIYASLRAIFGMFTCISSCKRLRLFPSEVDKLVGVSFQIFGFSVVCYCGLWSFCFAALMIGRHFSTEVLG